MWCQAPPDMGRFSRAFPNAYVDVEEPPNKSFRNKAIGLAALVGTAYFILVVLVLHLEPTGYDPLTNAVSDYAVGPFALQMQSAFFAGGVGLSCLGVASYLVRGSRREAYGSALILIAGLSLFLVGAFPTDIEGTPTTFHGSMHVALSAVVFIASPAGMLLDSSGMGRKWLWATSAAMALAFLSAFAVSALALNASGLSERLYIGVLVGWWLLASVRILRSP